MPWNLLGILYIVTALMCSAGFCKFVYFLSIGYGFAILGGGVAIFVMSLVSPTSTPLFITVLQLLLFVIYGARLSGFLLMREMKNTSFRKTEIAKETVGKEQKKMPFFVLFFIWITVSALYVAQLSPMLFRLINGSEDVILPLGGMIISLSGIILESEADREKSRQKRKRPDMVAKEGLYRIVRCPNYFGEITFWTGVFVSGITTYCTPGQWITALLAYAAIVYIMFNGAQRLEKRQMKRYGDNREYNEYAESTPIIIPFLPVYHLNRKQKTE